MKNSFKLLLVLTFFLLASVAFSAKIQVANLDGDWIGGFKIEDKWVLIDARFTTEDGITEATINFPMENKEVFIPCVDCLSDSRVKFELPNGTDTLLFDGKCDDVTFSGSVKNGKKEGAFHLFRVPKVDYIFADRW